MIYKHKVCSYNYLNELELIHLHTIKWFQILSSNTNNHIQY